MLPPTIVACTVLGVLVRTCEMSARTVYRVHLHIQKQKVSFLLSIYKKKNTQRNTPVLPTHIPFTPSWRLYWILPCPLIASPAHGMLPICDTGRSSLVSFVYFVDPPLSLYITVD